MGCGASTQKEPEKNYKEDSEGDLSDQDDNVSQTSATSESSATSSKSITRVTTTRRGYIASSSSAMPKLQQQQLFEPGMDPAVLQTESGGSAEGKANFLFGDFNVDPDDVKRQRVERLNRVRRPSRIVDSDIIHARKPVEVFMLNDFVINADDDDVIVDTSAMSIAVPSGFRKLSGFSVRTLIGHTDRVKALVLGREERSFLSAAITDSVVSMSDMNGEELNCYPGHEAYIVALALSRDGKLFASSARDGTIGVWEYSTNREHAMKKQVRAFAADEAQNAISISLAFGHTNRHLIAGGQDGCCRVWDIDRPGMPLVYERHSNVIVSVSPHPLEAVVASASGDKQIHLWSYETGDTTVKLLGHESAVISVTFTLDGKKLLSNDDRTCRIWNSETGECDLVVKLDSIATVPASRCERVAPKRVDSDYVQTVGMRYPKIAERLESALGGLNTAAARAAQMERVTARTIFTVSTLLPGPLSNSYFAVASTTGQVYIVNLINGQCEGSIPTKCPVFAIHSGSFERLLFGDIFGNVYLISFRS